jgi:predicted chitinase
VGFVTAFGSTSPAFTLEVMKSLYPNLNQGRWRELQAIADELNKHLEFYRLDTPLRRAHFFAQILQETGGALAYSESFYFSVDGLKANYLYFRRNPEMAAKHGYSLPGGKKSNGERMGGQDFEAIANGAYGGRKELGNGDFESGDGWRFRGRGLKQLTGRHHYETLTRWHKEHQSRWSDDVVDFTVTPDLVAEPKFAARSAANFWVKNKLYEIADGGSSSSVVEAITDVVNSGTASRVARVKHFQNHWGRGTFN